VCYCWPICKLNMDKKVVIASAPAKIILFGEHCVVLGTTAIATSISLRTWIKSELLDDQIILKIILPSKEEIKFCWNLNDCIYNEPIENPENPSESLISWIKLKTLDILPSYLIPACQSLLLAFILFHGARKTGLMCTVRSQIPVGVGLGSSAAYNVSLAASIMKFYDVIECEENIISKENFKKIQSYSLLFEKFMHGNPSGIDNTVSTYGGIVTFKKRSFSNTPWNKIQIFGNGYNDSKKYQAFGAKGGRVTYIIS